MPFSLNGLKMKPILLSIEGPDVVVHHINAHNCISPHVCLPCKLFLCHFPRFIFLSSVSKEYCGSECILEVAECLPRVYKALSLIPITVKASKPKVQKEHCYQFTCIALLRNRHSKKLIEDSFILYTHTHTIELNFMQVWLYSLQIKLGNTWACEQHLSGTHPLHGAFNITTCKIWAKSYHKNIRT